MAPTKSKSDSSVSLLLLLLPLFWLSRLLALSKIDRRRIKNSVYNASNTHRKKASNSVYPVKSVQPIFAKIVPNPIIPSISGHCNNLSRTPNAWPPTNSTAIRVGADVNVTYCGNSIFAIVHISIPIASNASDCDMTGHDRTKYRQLN